MKKQLNKLHVTLNMKNKRNKMVMFVIVVRVISARGRGIYSF